MKTKKIIDLVNQLIEAAKAEDEQLKKAKVRSKASQTIGESFMVHHLKILKEELEKTEDASQSSNNRPE